MNLQYDLHDLVQRCQPQDIWCASSHNASQNTRFLPAIAWYASTEL